MNRKQYQVSMEIAGNTAIWTRPDSGDSPCSYPAPTYSAVRGIFESILWGPAVLVIPRKVELCSASELKDDEVIGRIKELKRDNVKLDGYSVGDFDSAALDILNVERYTGDSVAVRELIKSKFDFMKQ